MQLNEVTTQIEKLKSENLALDMTRGKPSPQQLDISAEMINILNADDLKSQDGTDCRNYGVLDGIPEAKALFADLMNVKESQIIIGGNSSLELMHKAITLAVLFGVQSDDAKDKPWGKQETIKFLCPSPGYDRHFSVCEHLGIEMIPVAMNENGPDMDAVEELVANDDSIKGIWCVPKYSNPTGDSYSDEVVDRLASMKTKANDFRIMWDNAYAVHFVGSELAQLKDILPACEKAGNPDRAYIFGSTSKISFAGAGVAVIASSENNIAYFKKHLSIQTIGSDKLNQLRHVRFFKSAQGVHDHMQKHADILKPKFDAVLEVLEAYLGGKTHNDKPVATWQAAQGGYFISLDTQPGLAKKVVEKAASLGVKLTPAGATFPYGNDPQDSNIRIAPSFPNVEEVTKATEVLALAILSETLA